MAEVTPLRAEPPRAVPGNVLDNLSVLIVDDDAADLQLCSMMMRKLADGMQYKGVSSVEDACAHLEQAHVDCVLLDYHMGAWHAEGAIAALREKVKDTHLPIVVMSGTGDETKATSVMHAGASDYLAKDRMTSEALRRALSNSLDKALLARSLENERRSLVEANAELRRKSREIQSFYHTVSHELKTPITAIREFCSLMADEVLGEVNEQQVEALDVSIRSCDRLTCLVNDLFDAARIETGKLPLQLQSLAPRKLLETNVTIMQPRAEERGIALSLTLDSELPDVVADPNRIGQVLTNLIGNAIKFTDALGAIRVWAGFDAATNLLSVSVQDNGEGIAAEHAELIFDRLYQAETETVSSQNGMGIGLYLCRQIIHLHGGTVSVDSSLGEGSTFTFTLPVAENE